MSRARRRTARGGGRGRRRPVRAAGGRGLRIPWVPLVVVMAIVAAGGLVVYLIWQQTAPAGEAFAAFVRLEADPAPDLPGEYVDLQEIYGGTYGSHGDNATATHVTRDIDYVGDGNTNPPAGGPHWGRSACPEDPADAPPFCGPAPWGIFLEEPWEPETLVHNMEHGGVVLWYNTSDQAIVDELRELIEDRLRRNELLVMAPYPDMEEEYIALTSWARIDKFPVSDYSKERVEEYIDAHKCRFNPEGLSGFGC